MPSYCQWWTWRGLVDAQPLALMEVERAVWPLLELAVVEMAREEQSVGFV